MNEEELDNARKMIDHFCLCLEELGCDSVQIVATARFKNGNWSRLARGRGNIYARLGAVRDWIASSENGDLAKEVGQVINNNDDGESWK